MLRFRWVRTAGAVGAWVVWSMAALAADGPSAAGSAEPASEASKPAETAKPTETAKPAEAAESGDANAPEIARLITELDADQFDVRQRAAKRLAEIGREAIEALAKAAAGDSLEVTTRAVDILKKLYQSDDEATQKAAEAALEKLAQGNHAPSAWRAKSVLKVKPSGEPKPDENVQPGRIIIGGNIVPGIQIAQAGKAKAISISNRDGVKEIKVQEDGDRYHITVDDKKGIKVEITKKNKEGKEETKTIEAKDAEELKKKSEEAYKLYKEYVEHNAAGAIQVRIGGGAVPVPVPNIAPAAARRTQIEVVPRLIKSMSQSIQRIADEESIKSAPQESIDELKKSLDELKGQIAEIEKLIKACDEKAAKSDSAAKPAAEKPDPSAKPATDQPATGLKPSTESKPAAEAKPDAAQALPAPAAEAAKLVVPAVEVEVQVLPAQ